MSNLEIEKSNRRSSCRGRNAIGSVKSAQLVALFLLLLLRSLHCASALVNCTYGDSILGDSRCVDKYRSGSVCRENGFCSNPFRSGCLRNVLPEETAFLRPRACNSDDDPDAEERGECIAGDYNEIRILSQDWEGPMITAWIMQIILSEVLGVPTTLETSMPDSEASMNFYDGDMRFSYSNDTYDYDSIRTAKEHGGCHAFTKDRQEKEGWYRSCADIMPEAWNGQNSNIEGYVKEGTLEPSTGSGGVAKFSWYVPKFTAANHHDILSHYGLLEGTDLEVRRRLADLFLRPRKWKYFCDEVSPDNCATPYYDEEGRLIAARPPKDESEEGKFFKAGLYHGHFSASEDNDCDSNPAKCTGHIASPPCTWTNYVVPQIHHIGIPVWSAGTSTGAGNYKYGEMVGIYHAANYTKSNVLLYWYTPDPTVQEYMGSDAEFTPILLPQATVECTESRITEQQRCSDNPSDWIGDAAGSCDSESFVVQRLVVSNMYNRTYSVDKASRSPAYRFIKGFRLGDLQLELIYRRWYDIDTDRWNYDNRNAVCSWIGENIDKMKDFIPDTFPRTVRTSDYVSQALIGASILALVTAIFVLVTASMTFYYRKKRVMVHAQPIFLYIMLGGVLLVSIGAFLVSLTPSSVTCMLGEWFIMMGYSFVLVPLIVKVAAINVLFQSAAKFRRVEISHKRLYKTIGGIIGLVIAFLIAWTVVDPFTKKRRKDLTGERNEYDGEVVEMYYTCSSESSIWYIVLYVYVFLLIVAATVLAIQTRKVKQEFNESIRLGHVVYAHFLVEILLVLVWMLGPDYSHTLKANTAAAIKSYLLSINTLVILAVYFYPKILSARKPVREDHRSSISSISARFSTRASYIASTKPKSSLANSGRSSELGSGKDRSSELGPFRGGRGSERGFGRRLDRRDTIMISSMSVHPKDEGSKTSSVQDNSENSAQDNSESRGESLNRSLVEEEIVFFKEFSGSSLVGDDE